jgi:hypothetical protein
MRTLLLLATLTLTACSSSSPTTTAVDAAVEASTPASDATAGNAFAEAATDAASDASTRAAYGSPCTVGDDTTCQDGLLCLQGPSGGTVGFCTKTCPSTSSASCPGTPPGTAAYCVVTNVDTQGDKGCAFVCKEGPSTYPCPGALKCETSEDPPGSGQYLCLP